VARDQAGPETQYQYKEKDNKWEELTKALPVCVPDNGGHQTPSPYFATQLTRPHATAALPSAVSYVSLVAVLALLDVRGLTVLDSVVRIPIVRIPILPNSFAPSSFHLLGPLLQNLLDPLIGSSEINNNFVNTKGRCLVQYHTRRYLGCFP
jgi:hypothetical protein